MIDNNVYKYKLYLQEKKVKEKLSKTGKQINLVWNCEKQI